MPPRRGTRRTTARSRQTEQPDPKELSAQEVGIEIEDLANFAAKESRNIAVFGPSGVGKTVLASGAPRATILTTEKGLASAHTAGSHAGVMRAYDWEHVIAGMNLAKQKLGAGDWFVVDSGTKMQVLYMRWILRMQNEANSSRSLDIPALQDHQQYQNGFKRFCDDLIDAEFNTIFVFGEMEIATPDGDLMWVPHIEGGRQFQVCKYIIGQFDVGIRYTISKSLSSPGHTVRLALCQPTAEYWAKDRYSALGEYQTVEPGEYEAMTDFVEMIDEAIKKEG